MLDTNGLIDNIISFTDYEVLRLCNVVRNCDPYFGSTCAFAHGRPFSCLIWLEEENILQLDQSLSSNLHMSL